MSHVNIAHRRTHNLLLISKLLSQREGVSPFTLVLDTLEQPATPVLREYLRRARLSRTTTVFLSYETFSKPRDVDFFIGCHGEGRGMEGVRRDVMDVINKSGGKSTFYPSRSRSQEVVLC